MHTCMRAYIQAHSHTFIHAYLHILHLHTYMRMCIHAYVRTCARTQVHTYVRTFTRTCVHTYIRIIICSFSLGYINIYIYIYIHIRTDMYSNVQSYRWMYVHRYRISTSCKVCTNMLTRPVQGPSHGRRRAGQRSQSDCRQLCRVAERACGEVVVVCRCLRDSGLLTVAAAVVMLAQCVKHATAPVDAVTPRYCRLERQLFWLCRDSGRNLHDACPCWVLSGFAGESPRSGGAVGKVSAQAKSVPPRAHSMSPAAAYSAGPLPVLIECFGMLLEIHEAWQSALSVW